MYKTTKFIFQKSVDGAFMLRKYVTVETGLTYAQAKERRESDGRLQIVRM